MALLFMIKLKLFILTLIIKLINILFQNQFLNEFERERL